MITPLLEQKHCHSAKVRIRLLLNGRSIPVAQLGPDFLILHEACEHPPTHAEMSLTVDGAEERWPVYLREGIRRGERMVMLSTG